MSSNSPAATTDSASARISNQVVRLMHEYTGRGPTKARTYINDRLVTVVLSDTLTRGEQSLVRDGQADFVLSVRKAYQTTMRRELVAAVETTIDRKVVAFMSDNHIEPDVAVELFVLAPGPDGGDGEAEPDQSA